MRGEGLCEKAISGFTVETRTLGKHATHEGKHLKVNTRKGKEDDLLIPRRNYQ
jgi:hypothetical protein